MTRSLAAVSLLVAILALAVSATALVLALRHNGGEVAGRTVVLSLDGRVPGEPQLVDDEFWLVGVRRTGDDAEVDWVALYPVVPHLVFGLQRGCRVEWDRERRLTTNSGVTHDGVFFDGCSGSIFGADGARLFGPAYRDLDQFLLCAARRPRKIHCRYTGATVRGSGD